MRMTSYDMESIWKRRAIEGGLTRAGYRHRREVQGLSPEEAATRPKRRDCPVVHHGQTLASIAKAAGITAVSLYKHLDRHPDGRPAEVIAAEIAERQAQRQVNKERKAECERRGIGWDTVRARMKREGISFEEAVARPVMSRVEMGHANAHHLRGARQCD